MVKNENENIGYDEEEEDAAYFDSVSGREIKKKASILNKARLSKKEMDQFFSEEESTNKNYEEKESPEDSLEEDDELSKV